MGKQSRRKGPKQSRAEKLEERKRRLNEQDRRQRREEQEILEEEEPQNKRIGRRTIFQDDRVWFWSFDSEYPCDKSNPDTYRGIVDSIDDDGKYAHIRPLFLADTDTVWKIPIKHAYLDAFPQTLEHKVGDKIICNTDEGAFPGVLEYLWPVWEEPPWPENDHEEFQMPCYQIRVSMGDLYSEKQEFTKIPSSFRFRAGDNVIVDAYQLLHPETGYDYPFPDIDSLTWLPATVYSVIKDGIRKTRRGSRYVYPCFYECTLEDGAHVLVHGRDNSEFICSADRLPRERLFDAIEEDCSLTHIEYLIDCFQIDVASFESLALSKAVEFASYNMLTWLEQNLDGPPLSEIRDGQGNGILHQIAQSRFAVRFFKNASSGCQYGADLSEKCSLFKRWSYRTPNERLNDKGETWLDILAQQGHTRAFDLIFCPHNPIFKKSVTFWHADDVVRVLESSTGNEICRILRDYQIAYHTRLLQFDLLNMQKPDSKVTCRHREMIRTHTSILAEKLVIRFLKEFCDISQWESDVCALGAKGFVDSFKRFFEADKLTILCATHKTSVFQTCNEFVQLELYRNSFDLEFEELDIASAVGFGIGDVFPTAEFDTVDITQYLSFLGQCCELRELDPLSSKKLVDAIEIKADQNSRGLENDVFQTKIYHLKDRPMSKKRLEVVGMLVFEENQKPPNALDAIRFRKCDALQWLVAKNFLSLASSATDEKMLSTSLARRMQFLDGKRPPKTLTTAVFLSFACVEFDDLQSLEWIIQESGIEFQRVTVAGFDLLHACAFFGRLEIIIRLRDYPGWDHLASNLCSRKPFDGMQAVHIAIMRGHTNAADILLRLGAPDADAQKRSSTFHAKKSPHHYVRSWGEKRAGPLVLAQDIDKLLRLIAKGPLESAKGHVQKSRCLQIDTWKSCDSIHHFDDRLEPARLSYKEVFQKIFSICEDQDFIFWLCMDTTISRSKIASDWEKDGKNRDVSQFWDTAYWLSTPKSTKLVYSRMKQVATDTKDSDLLACLDLFRSRNLSIYDPTDVSPFLTCGLLNKEMKTAYRTKLCRLDSVLVVLRETEKEIRKLMTTGGMITTIKSLIKALKGIYSIVAGERDMLLEEFDDKLTLYSPSTEKIKIDFYPAKEAFGTSLYSKQLRLAHSRNSDLRKFFYFLAVEGDVHLTTVCLELGRNWTEEIVLEMIQTSSFLGHFDFADLFLINEDQRDLQSSWDKRAFAALLGFAEGGHESAFIRLVASMSHSLPPDPISEIRDHEIQQDVYRVEECWELLSSSLSATIVYGALSEDRTSRKHVKELMKWIVHKQLASIETLAKAATLIFPWVYEISKWRHARELFVALSKLGFGAWTTGFHQMMLHISSKMFSTFTILHSDEDDKDQHIIAQEWLSQMCEWGLDIQTLKIINESDKFDSLRCLLTDAQRRQRKIWQQFDALKDAKGIGTLKARVNSGEVNLSDRNKGGLTWLHVAAAYDNVKALKWLVEERGQDMSVVDFSNRTVLDVTIASRASSARQWIRHRNAKSVISTFLSKNFRRALAIRRKIRMLRSVIKIQSLYRGYRVSKVYRMWILSRLDSMQQFNLAWFSVVSTVEKRLWQHSSWASIRNIMIEIRPAGNLALEEMTESLQTAALQALQDDNAVGTDAQNTDEELLDDYEQETLSNTDSSLMPQGNSSVAYSPQTKILISAFVSKWLKHADAKYRGFFFRRLQQLQAGDRSRILAKRLKGSQTTIFETYLEQKSGQRILWTERKGVNGILIWYVAKHKSVSRMMLLIDDAQIRSSRQQVRKIKFEDASVTENHGAEINDQVILNPIGNVPLKIYEIRNDELETAALDDSWTPRLHLSREERDIVESKGTILLLGRSGTGKTVCICNRMDMDRKIFSHVDGFRQLFVARSERLSRYVAEAVGETPFATYSTFDQVVMNLEEQTARNNGNNSFSLQSRKMNFSKFKNLIYAFDKAKAPHNCDPMIAWACIRSFIKGSIEAVMEPTRILPRKKFLELGKKRCRLSVQQREIVYSIFETYQGFLKDQQLWDECDRIMILLERVELAMENRDEFANIKQSKIYVDEIQDYTQAEILLFFKLSGPGDLFLAGDPAQSVAEGVEFRFEEIRSVGYHIAEATCRRDLIPEKPKIVNVNFRSHSGILNVAAATLRVLFGAFPDSAKQLSEDRGVFSGPRPGTFHKVETERLRELVSTKLNGIVVLTRDESVSYWKERLGGYPLVFGIRAAKGLEFKNVILLNFGAELPRQLQKPWRDLLLGRESAASFRELEGELKLLYTGVTRCIEQLFIAETVKSIAGDTIIRWLTTTSTIDGSDGLGNALATKNNVDNIATMIMTSDEWLATGLENSEMAEQCESPEESESWLEKAVFCFEQAKNVDLAKKARVHRSSAVYRSSLLSLPMDSPFTIEQEIEAAHRIETLLKEGLGGEAKAMLDAILPFVDEPSRSKLSAISRKLAE